MKILQIRFKPLFLTFKQPYHWSGRVDYGAAVILIEVETDEGLIGRGESTAAFPADGSLQLLGNIVPLLLGRSPFEIDRLICRARHLGLINDTIRFPNLALAGLDMALWDIAGQAAGLPLYEMLGGLVRDEVDYFSFVQGDTAAELTESVQELLKNSGSVVYMKVGRGEQSDVENTAAVRKLIGDNYKLRLDGNEAWNVFTAKNMIKKLSAFDIEFVEQPTPCRTIAALKQIKMSSPVPIAADQSVYSMQEAYDLCRQEAADVLVLSPHETGGISPFKKTAAIAEAAGIPICLHGQFVSGITDLCQHHLGLTIPNLTDGSQIMHQLLKEDLLDGSELEPRAGKIGVLPRAPGLGLKLNWDAVSRAAEAYNHWTGNKLKNVEFVYSYT
ncbi:MAG: mandelate racemase/muconate lactonizing enzyme family protein [Treponema sp.]|jgi:muconate cycloisomerase|nr:mandelate racemase/muconate lactonizing enzyme family protein [Treponema sp.]